MRFIIQRYFWLAHLLTIAICSFFAAKAIGRYIEINLSGSAQLPLRALPRHSLLPSLTSASPREISTILERNIFCSSCEKITAEEAPGNQSGEHQNEGQPVKTSLELQLLATLTNDENPAWNYALILDPESNQARIFGLGSNIQSNVIVTDILDRTVFILHDGRQEYLALVVDGTDARSSASAAKSGESSGTPKFRMPEPLKGMETYAKGIRRVGGTKYEIERRVLNQLLSNTAMIASSSRIVPAVKDGQTIGFRVYSSVGSIPSLLGLFSGDTIVSVNGSPIASSEQALSLLTQLRSSSYVTLTFTRQGTPITHEYMIR